MARSESNLVKLGGTGTYPDLNMTHYPDKIDTRVAGAGYNPNLRGFENRKDYNLAEHVNALGDAVMAVERSLGVTPYLDKDGVNRATVSARITTLEKIDLDPRYGGVGWNPTQTLVGHKHTGSPGGPSKISLASEITGKLPKANLDLVYNSANGLTGSDIAVSKHQSTTIDVSINDKLSTSQGGAIEKSLTVKGNMMSKFYMDIDSSNVIPGSGTTTTDIYTRSNRSIKVTNTASLFINKHVDLEYGKYIAVIRMKTMDNTTTNELLTFNTRIESGGTGFTASTKGIKGTDFLAPNTWQSFYFVFNVVNTTFLQLKRNVTDKSFDVYFDYAHICPAHPAIYDN